MTPMVMPHRVRLRLLETEGQIRFITDVKDSIKRFLRTLYIAEIGEK